MDSGKDEAKHRERLRYSMRRNSPQQRDCLRGAAPSFEAAGE